MEVKRRSTSVFSGSVLPEKQKQKKSESSLHITKDSRSDPYARQLQLQLSRYSGVGTLEYSKVE